MADIFGTPGDDNLVGTPDPDFIFGDDGDDTVTADAGDDEVFGGAGDDTLIAGDGNDTVAGGDDNDVIDLGDGFDFAFGGQGDDTIRGGAGNDNLFGESTTETQNGITGDDQLFGGDGDDFMRGGLGNDYMDGGSGSDRASYFAIPGGVTVDLRIQGSAQNTGPGGIDTLVNVENVAGSEFSDVLIGNNLANWFWSHGGADVITGNAGDDTFWMPQGDGASIHGNQGVDVVSFTGRIDLTTTGITIDLGVQGSAQDTGRGLITLRSIEGAEGSDFDDTIEGNSGDNVLSGRAGSDIVDGLGGDDLIQGDVPVRFVGEVPFDINDPAFIQGDDVLNGGGGEDAIYGDGGDDTIDGGNAADTISGGAGADNLTGGGGDDQFVYASASESSSVTFDTLVGFNFQNTDIFDLPVAVTSVSQVIGGTLDAATFDANLSVEMNAGVLSVNEAVLFTPTVGSYAGEKFLIVDGNGVAGYQAGEDFVFLLDSPAKINFFDVGDFI